MKLKSQDVFAILKLTRTTMKSTHFPKDYCLVKKIDLSVIFISIWRQHRDISNKCHFYLNRIRKQRYFEQNWLHFAIWRSCAGADGRFANSVEFADKGILMPLNWVIIINTTDTTKTTKTTTTKTRVSCFP